MSPTRPQVSIIYPADPLGVIPGGIDTFIRGILSWAPDDIDMHVVGITTDSEQRPKNRWTVCELGRNTFRFYPIMSVRHSERQALVPVTLRFLLSLRFRNADVPGNVLEFHRIEPCVSFLSDRRPKTLVMHQNMQVLRNAGSDIRWRYAPQLYFKLEDRLFPHFSSVFCVREDAAADYRERFAAMAGNINFTPTWVDTEVFRPSDADKRERGRATFRQGFGFDAGHFVLVTVGRLDKQKNPLLLVDSFAELYKSNPDMRLLMVGDGVLREEIEARLRERSLQDVVKLSGVRRAPDVSRYLQAADLFVLSSAYEGMPMCVLEALGSGLPVVTTAVGEVARVVKPGINGEIVTEHRPAALAAAIARCKAVIGDYRGEPCLKAVENYTPQKVLAPVYENYRRLAARYAAQRD